MSDDPLYRRLADRLRLAFVLTGLRPGDRLPPLRELVATTGSNLPLVRKAIHLLVDQGMLVTRKGAGIRLCRRSNPVPGEHRRVLFLSTDVELHQGFIARQVDELLRQATLDQIEVLAEAIPHDGDGSVALMTAIAAAPQAVILSGNTRYAAIRQLEAAGYPVIVSGEVGECDRAAVLRRVSGADEETSYLLAQHLVALGHRRIGLVRSRGESPWQMNRIHGLIAGLGDAGCWDPDLVASVDVPDEPARTHAEIVHLFDRSDRPTALIVLGDWMAEAVYAACESLRLGIPEHVSVAGFGEIPHGAEQLRPPLSTAQLDMSTWMQGLLLLLKEALAGRPPRTIQLTRRLILRGSTRSLHTCWIPTWSGRSAEPTPSVHRRRPTG